MRRGRALSSVDDHESALSPHLKRRALHDRRQSATRSDSRLRRAPSRRSLAPPARRSTPDRGQAHRSAASRSAWHEPVRTSAAPAATRPGRRTWCRRATRPTRRSAQTTRRASAIVRPHRSSRATRPSGSIIAWQLAQTGLARCCSIRSRIEQHDACAIVRRRSGGTFGSGGGGGVPSRFSRIHLPRTTGDVRSGYDVTVRMLPCPSRPRALAVRRKRDAPEVAALDVGNAVVRAPAVR